MLVTCLSGRFANSSASYFCLCVSLQSRVISVMLLSICRRLHSPAKVLTDFKLFRSFLSELQRLAQLVAILITIGIRR